MPKTEICYSFDRTGALQEQQLRIVAGNLERVKMLKTIWLEREGGLVPLACHKSTLQQGWQT